jgi:hypothetical protein
VRHPGRSAPEPEAFTCRLKLPDGRPVDASNVEEWRAESRRVLDTTPIPPGLSRGVLERVADFLAAEVIK